MALVLKRSEDSQVESNLVRDSVEAEIVSEILRVSTPVKVVLFGSRARGDFDEESDYDVLVVLSDEAELKAEQAKLKAAMMKLPARVQVLVKRWSEYEAMSGVTVGLWRNIRDEGVVLYEQELPNAIKPLDMKTNQDIAKTLLEKAKKDKERAATLLAVSPNDMEGIGFNAQQAIEKALKAVLAHRDVHFPRTHDLREILRLLVANGIGFDERLNEAVKLNEFAVEMRYDTVQFEIDAKTAVDLAEQAIAFAENLITQQSSKP